MQTPLRFRPIADRMLVTNEVGEFSLFADDVIDRLFVGNLLDHEQSRLRDMGIIIDARNEWRLASLMHRMRKMYGGKRNGLSYLIVIPTLRCDLSCTYCQVSRAPVDAPGFDWTNEHLVKFDRFLDSIESDRLKLEFQGGEPTLRPDLLERIMEICNEKFASCEFVICTNLVHLSAETERLIARDDVFISTSIDGPASTMTVNRTSSTEKTDAIFANFRHIVDKYGPGKVSALPTVTEESISDPKGLVDFYVSLGFESIFLRPVNYMGFARKAHGTLSQDFGAWNLFYRDALEHIIDINSERYFEEFYLSLVVRSIFAGIPHGYVDLSIGVQL